MSKYLIDAIERRDNVEVLLRSRVVDGDGDTHLDALRIVDDADAPNARSRPTACS